jgi:hypothetical protein
MITLPSDPDPAFAGIALAATGELAVEARIQPGVRSDGELGAMRAASLEARGPSTVNAAPGSAMKMASIARVELNSCTHDNRAYGDSTIPLLKAKRVPS